MLSADELLASWETRSTDSGEGVLGTGLRELDEVTGGFRRGQVWIVMASPGQGMTSLLAQWAARVALAGWPTRLVCPREPREFLTARLLSIVGRVVLLDLHRQQGDDYGRLARAKETLRGAPLHVATLGESTFLDWEGGEDPLPAPSAVIVDDADLISGVFPEQAQALASDGSLVIVAFPRHLVVRGTQEHPTLDPAWARVADVILEVQQAAWPGDTDSLRPGEADLHVLKNRWGYTRTVSVGFQAHYSRFVDVAH